VSEPTDADREKASRLWARCRDGSAPALVHEIAAVLAEEREKSWVAGAREALIDAADEATVLGRRGPNAIADWLLDRSYAIRRAAEETK
jgi:hypothetical protein